MDNPRKPAVAQKPSLSKNQRRRRRRKQEASGQAQMPNSQTPQAKSLNPNTEKLMAAIDKLIMTLPISEETTAQPEKEEAKTNSDPKPPPTEEKEEAKTNSDPKPPPTEEIMDKNTSGPGTTVRTIKKPLLPSPLYTSTVFQMCKETSSSSSNEPRSTARSASTSSSLDTVSTSSSSEASTESSSRSSSSHTTETAPTVNSGDGNPTKRGPLIGRVPNQPKPGKKKKSKEAVVDVLVQHVQKLLETWSDHAPDAEFCCRFMDLLQAPDKLMYGKYLQVREDFMPILHNKLSYFDIHPFGSTVSGLSFRDSDFDIYVHNNLARIQMNRFLRDVCDEMRRKRTFNELVVISKARIPLIKAVHIATGSKVDFSFGEHYFGVQNTYIVKYLSLFDVRIKPLTLLLKYWFRANDFSGTGKFTNYCMFMLIVYFLQVQKYPILPPLIHFQRHFPVNEVAGWNVAFNFNLKFPNYNHSSVFQLMFGFFNFYSHFDFKKQVICPLYARVYDRNTFPVIHFPEQQRYYNHIEKFPDETLRMKLPACVQDPITMNINIGTCSENVFEVFEEHMKTMVNLINSKNLVRIEKVGELKDLFSCRPIIKKKPKIGLNLSLHTKIVAKPAELVILKKILGADIDQKILLGEWMTRVVDYVQQVLIKYMALDVSLIEMADIGPPKSPKLDGQSEACAENKNILRKFKCIATKNVFQRQIGDQKMDPDAFFEAESKSVANLIKMNGNKMLGAMFIITLATTDDPTRITFTLSNPSDFIKLPDTTQPSRKTTKECKMIFNFFAQQMRIFLAMFFTKLAKSSA